MVVFCARENATDLILKWFHARFHAWFHARLTMSILSYVIVYRWETDQRLKI